MKYAARRVVLRCLPYPFVALAIYWIVQTIPTSLELGAIDFDPARRTRDVAVVLCVVALLFVGAGTGLASLVSQVKLRRAGYVAMASVAVLVVVSTGVYYFTTGPETCYVEWLDRDIDCRDVQALEDSVERMLWQHQIEENNSGQ